MPSTHKKVIVRKLDRDAVQGYVNPASFVVEGRVALLSPEGQVLSIGLEEIKGVYFVREFSESMGKPIERIGEESMGHASGWTRGRCQL